MEESDSNRNGIEEKGVVEEEEEILGKIRKWNGFFHSLVGFIYDEALYTSQHFCL